MSAKESLATIPGTMVSDVYLSVRNGQLHTRKTESRYREFLDEKIYFTLIAGFCALELGCSSPVTISPQFSPRWVCAKPPVNVTTRRFSHPRFTSSSSSPPHPSSPPLTSTHLYSPNPSSSNPVVLSVVQGR